MKQNSLTEGSILKALIGFALPVLGALFLQALYGAVDLLVVGKFADVAEQSGVASGSMFTTTLTGVISAFAIGLTVMVGEAVGEKNTEKVKKSIGTGICILAIIAVLSTIIIAPLAGTVANAMHAPPEAVVQTTEYIRICGLGLFFIIFYNVLAAIFRGMGDAKTPLITVIVACIINIIADLVFVIVFGWGAKGAAIATVLAQAMSVIISVVLIRKRGSSFGFSVKDLKISKWYAKKMFLVGTPVAVQELLVGLSFIFIQSTVNSIGVIASGGVGIGEKVCAFLMLVASSYMQSMAAFTAQNNGAGKHERAKKGLKIGISTAFIAGVTMGLLAFFAGDVISSVFTNEPAVIVAAHSYLKAYAIDCLLTAVLFCFIGYYNGNEHTMFVLLQGIVGAFCARIPLVMLFNKLSEGDLFCIGLATPCSSVVQIVLCVLAYFVFEKKLILKAD
ncbi:MAG: MATE family efflux transporter [Ruminiclostridium sp.]|nr:MATE family efflux transporter [Ruminiclostridium sp.]